MNTTVLDTEEPFFLVTGSYCIFLAFSTILSITFFVLIFTYLNNLSLAKECVLVYLYKDVSITCISINCLWLTQSVFLYLTRNASLGGIEAKVFSYMLCSLLSLCGLLMNVISAIKFYMTKTNVLDPPMPWGEDEQKGIKAIRAICFILITGFASIMFVLRIYPYYFYTITRQGYDVELPEIHATAIYPSVYIILIVTFVITSVGAKFYRSANKKEGETNDPLRMNNYFWVALITIPVIIILTMTKILSDRYIVRNLIRSILFILQIIFPVTVILRNCHLKSYAFKQFEDKFHSLFLLSIYVTPVLIMLFMNITLYVVYNFFGI